MARMLYEWLDSVEVQMELKHLLGQGTKINDMRFRLRLHTAPSPAATGLRYVRILANLLEEIDCVEHPSRLGSPGS